MRLPAPVPHLDDLREVLLLLEDVARDVAEVGELGVLLVEVGAQHAHVLGVGDVPVDGREVLALRELLVEAPEHLDDAERRGRHGVGEVAAGRAHCSDDSHAPLALGRPEAPREAGALVEALRRGGRQAGRVLGLQASVEHPLSPPLTARRAPR